MEVLGKDCLTYPVAVLTPTGKMRGYRVFYAEQGRHMKTIFITGGTGYIGTRLIGMLLLRGHRVIALVRPGSEHKVPAGAEVTSGDPLKADSFTSSVPAGCTFVQLLGVPHPSPRKRDLFYTIDLASLKASADAAFLAGAAHFVYVSVAQEPTNIMKDYQAARAAGEQYIIGKGLSHTFIRPWYVLGPGHWWPILFLPLYTILRWLPATRKKATALGLVTIRQMLSALLASIEYPESTGTIMDVEAIKIKKRRDK